MKKSNWILVGIVVLLVLLGFLYLNPIREGNKPKQNKDNTKIMDKSGRTINVKPVKSSLKVKTK